MSNLINLAQIKDGKKLQTDLAALKTLVGTVPEEADSSTVSDYATEVATEKSTEALTSAKSYTDEKIATVSAEAGAKVASVTAKDASVTVDNADPKNPKLSVAVSATGGNALTKVADGLMVTIPEAVTYNMTKKEEAEAGMFATYVFSSSENAEICKINVPKDYVVQSAALKEVEVAEQPYAGAVVGEKYIDFTINTEAGDGNVEHIYLKVNDLVDVYTGEATAEVTVNVSPDCKITATLNNGSIALAKLASDVTAAIADAKAAGTTAQGEVDALEGRVGALETAVGDSGDIATRLTAVEGKANTNEAAITVLNGNDTTAGSVAKAVKDSADALKATLDTTVASMVPKVEKFDIAAAQAEFTLTGTPNEIPVELSVNGIVYTETGADITVDREGKKVTWANTAAAGGFDIDNTVTDKVLVKYYTFVIPE